MEKEIMIKAIYEKIADKTLSFGCEIEVMTKKFDIEKCRFIRGHFASGKFLGGLVSNLIIYEEDISYKQLQKVLGHPVMIGDFIDYIQNDNFSEKDIDFKNEIVSIWLEARKPIEEQSEECIEYVYNLIK